MPATEFKAASSKELVFQTASGQPSHTAGLEVRRPGAATELRKPAHPSPWVSCWARACSTPGCLVPSVFTSGLRAGHLPSSCSCLPELESIIPLFPWETRGVWEKAQGTVSSAQLSGRLAEPGEEGVGWLHPRGSRQPSIRPARAFAPQSGSREPCLLWKRTPFQGV